MNDELMEGQRETELELREQVETSRGHLYELTRQLEANKENLADYETTVAKFRELVTNLQAQNTQLSQSLADSRRSNANSASSANLAAMAAGEASEGAAATALLLASPSMMPRQQPAVQNISKVCV